MSGPGRVLISSLMVAAGLAVSGLAGATDLPSGTVPYALDGTDSPYVVGPATVIDTSGGSSSAIAIRVAPGVTEVQLTNAGRIVGGFFVVQNNGPTRIVNNGTIQTGVSTAIAMFGGGSVVNLAGGVIQGQQDGIYLPDTDAAVTNAGTISGRQTRQAGVNMPFGGTVTNLPGGTIRGEWAAIFGASGVNIANSGLITATQGTAIRLTEPSASGATVINNGIIQGADGTAILFGVADDHLVLGAASAISGIVDAGGAATAAGNRLTLGGEGVGVFDIGALGPTAQYRNFQSTLKDGAGTWTLTGSNATAQIWQISAGTLIVAGALNGGIATAPGAADIRIEIAPGGSVVSAEGVGIVAGTSSRVVIDGTLSGTGAALRFTGTDSQLVLGGTAQVTGLLDGGDTNNALVLRGSGVLSAPVRGFATMAVQGGVWTLNSEARILQGTTISAGRLHLNGVLDSPSVQVAAGAGLIGTGTLRGALLVQGGIAPGETATLNPAGTLPPLSPGRLRVEGSYVQTATSQYLVEIAAQAQDLIEVSGKAELRGGQVFARLRPLTFRPSDTYTILTADGGVTGTFDGVTSSNPFVVPTLAYDATSVRLVVTRGFRQAGGTPNQIAVEQGLDHAILTGSRPVIASGDLLAVVIDLIGQEGRAAYAALDQLGAESYAGLQNANLSAVRLGTAAIGEALSDARQGRRCDAASAVRDARWCVWAGAVGSSGRVGGYDTWLRQETALAGVLSGADYAVSNHLRIGGAAGYVQGRAETGTLPARGRVNSYQFALYGSYVADLLWLHAIAGYARGENDMKRDILFTGPARLARGAFGSDQFFGSVQLGRDIPLGMYGVVAPFLRLEGATARFAGFTETGAQSVDLDVGGRTVNTFGSVLGGRWDHTLVNADGARLLLGLMVGWRHEYGAVTRRLEARFTGSASSDFVQHGAGPARDTGLAGAGIGIPVGGRGQVFLRYDAEFSVRDMASMVGLGFVYRW